MPWANRFRRGNRLDSIHINSAAPTGSVRYLSLSTDAQLRRPEHGLRRGQLAIHSYPYLCCDRLCVLLHVRRNDLFDGADSHQWNRRRPIARRNRSQDGRERQETGKRDSSDDEDHDSNPFLSTPRRRWRGSAVHALFYPKVAYATKRLREVSLKSVPAEPFGLQDKSETPGLSDGGLALLACPNADRLRNRNQEYLAIANLAGTSRF
jgi:hypothetical protein